MLNADASYSQEKIDVILRSSKVRIIIFRISHISNLLYEFRGLIDRVKELGSLRSKLDKILFIISRADTGSYLNDDELKATLNGYPIGYGEDITIGAAYGKCSSLLGRVKVGSNLGILEYRDCQFFVRESKRRTHYS